MITAVVVRVSLGSPVIFRQRRPGLGGQSFMLFKFRTMLGARSANGQLLPDDERMTSVGNFLRSSSLDELPALFNVIRGEMSLVGPRPLLMEYLPLYSERQNQRHNVRPGLTGWAQVNGRNLLSWPEKLELDVWYVENRSFWLDLKILFMTVGQVLRREGISHGGHVTMEHFKGNRS
jgi:sugar transferase EpsL